MQVDDGDARSLGPVTERMRLCLLINLAGPKFKSAASPPKPDRGG
jgi:hypothetical protein